MSAERPVYVDSSALVKLAVRELESQALRAYLRRRRPLICSALARTEVMRALLPLGSAALQRGQSVLSRIELVRLGNRILDEAGAMTPTELRSLDAVHLATAALATARGPVNIVTYDDRMAEAARQRGWRVSSPA
jgi:uncharacterized protein